MTDSSLAIGIDVGELGGKRLDLVALDSERRIMPKLRRASLDEVARVVLVELRPQVVCIDSPPQWAQPGTRRDCERALTRAGINLFTTPSEDRSGAFHRWMRDGFKIFEAIRDAYPRYVGGPATSTAAEYFPHASAVALAGYIAPIRENSRFRKAILESHGVEVSELASVDQIDAALGALTGLLALENSHSWVGGVDGTILLPVGTIPDRFPRRARAIEGPRTRPQNPCACGCGALGPGRFRPGHDAKLLSRLKRTRDLET